MGKKAVVTGGSKGIGRAIAEACARAGAGIVVLARKPDELAETELPITRIVLGPLSPASVRTIVAETLSCNAEQDEQAEQLATISELRIGTQNARSAKRAR